MQHRTLFAGLAIALAAVLSQATNVHAGPVGTQGLADVGGPTVDTGDINTATTFTIGDLLSTYSHTGVFVGMTAQDFGPASFTTTSPTSFSFGNSVFGSFSSNVIMLAAEGPGTISYYIAGEYTPGSYVTGYGSGPFAASLTISFTQTPPGPGGAISDSATFSVPPTPPPSIPEPASVVLGLTGILGCGLMHYLRRRSIKIA
jgi:hypothetical protein